MKIKKVNSEKNSELVKTILRINPALDRRYTRESYLASKMSNKNLNFFEKRQRTFLVSFNDRRIKTYNHYERLREAFQQKYVFLWIISLKSFIFFLLTKDFKTYPIIHLVLNVLLVSCLKAET